MVSRDSFICQQRSVVVWQPSSRARDGHETSWFPQWKCWHTLWPWRMTSHRYHKVVNCAVRLWKQPYPWFWCCNNQKILSTSSHAVSVVCTILTSGRICPPAWRLPLKPSHQQSMIVTVTESYISHVYYSSLVHCSMSVYLTVMIELIVYVYPWAVEIVADRKTEVRCCQYVELVRE